MADSNVIEKGATGVISHHVREGKQEGYEKWLDEIGAVCKSYPGHLDVQVVRPIKGLTQNYTIIIRFGTHAHLHAWLTSADRKRLIEKAGCFLVKEVYEIRSGLDFWFMPQSAHAPTRWKQVLLTWSAIYPLGLVIPLILTPVIHKLGLPQNHYFTYFIGSGLLVLLMSYIVMPRYTRLVRRWLFR